MATARQRKAHESKVLRAIRNITKSISSLADSTPVLPVLEIIRGNKACLLVRREAVFLMANESSRFENHQVWHQRLVALLNDPLHGPSLFKALCWGAWSHNAWTEA